MITPREDSSTTTTTTTTITSVYCGQCGVDARPFLHHLRHRGNFRRLCTTCVLRLSASSFCPTCFLTHDSRPTPIPLPIPDSVTCSKCYSSSHNSCVGPTPNTPYVCPLCSSPNSPIFTLKNKVIDKSAATVLLAAAKIAADSMNKAAVAVRDEAEKRAKEAAVARRRAKEAMEHLVVIENKERLRKMGLVVANGNGNGNNRIVTNVGERNLFGDRNRVDRVDSSSAVLAALNAVELREKEKVVVMVRPEDVVMEVDGKGRSNGSGNEGCGGSLGGELVPVLNVEPIAVVRVEQQQQQNGGNDDHGREENAGSQQ